MNQSKTNLQYVFPYSDNPIDLKMPPMKGATEVCSCMPKSKREGAGNLEVDYVTLSQILDMPQYVHRALEKTGRLKRCKKATKTFFLKINEELNPKDISYRIRDGPQMVHRFFFYEEKDNLSQSQTDNLINEKRFLKHFYSNSVLKSTKS